MGNDRELEGQKRGRGWEDGDGGVGEESQRGRQRGVGEGGERLVGGGGTEKGKETETKRQE